MCTYMPLGTNEMKNADTSEMSALSSSKMNVLDAYKVNAQLLLWVLSRTSCISNLILLLN